MYFDEEIVLDIRLNALDKYVDYFVIVESIYTHKGDRRELKFNQKKFYKFKDKIKYIIYKNLPQSIEKIYDNDSEAEKSRKYILNAAYRENGQRNFITNGLENANDDDMILVSDVDEIPNLQNIDFKKISKKIIIFKQDMFYYKFNLKMPDLIWSGTKACKKKHLINPQWLRNIKDRKYPLYRVDTLFSDKKYINIEFVNNGGWHFSNIKSPEEIEYKLKSYLHHREFDENPLSKNQISEIIKKKQAIYDLKVDKKINKIGNGSQLIKYPTKKLPLYLQNNLYLYNKWLD